MAPCARRRSEPPEAASALHKEKPRLVPITRQSVSSNSPESSATLAVTAATNSPATSVQPTNFLIGIGSRADTCLTFNSLLVPQCLARWRYHRPWTVLGGDVAEPYTRNPL